MKEYNIQWLSRHEMSAEQTIDVWNFLGVAEDTPKCITQDNILWQASTDAGDDIAKNLLVWKAASKIASCVAGVFPPVALEALREYRRKYPHTRLRVITPVSKQTPELRVGEGPIPYVHLRWVEY